MRKDAEKLIASLAGRIGDENLSLNTYDRCATIIEDIPFTFTYSPERSCLFINAELGKVNSAEVSETVLEKLMNANNNAESTAGGVIGLNKEDGKAYLSHSINLPLPEGAGSEHSLSMLLPRLIPVASWATELLKKRSPAAPLNEGDYRNLSRV